MLPAARVTVPGPGTLGPPPPLHALGPISPSHVLDMEACALREVWSAGKAPPALPAAPAAIVGSVAHHLLEESGRGQLPISEIERRWNQLVRGAEESCTRSWLNRHLAPLERTVPDYEVRRLQALAAARTIASEAERVRYQRLDLSRELPSGSEVPVATPDGRAAGRIDAVVQTVRGPVLRDYKSGAIYTRGVATYALKPEYSIQLKIYAAMYAAMTGTWPVRLEVVPISGQPVEVAFTKDESASLLARAFHIRDEINAVVEEDAPALDRMHTLATPGPSECGYCTYRPYCVPYEAARRNNPGAAWPVDTWGDLADMQLLRNGRRLLTLNAQDGINFVRGIDPSPGRHPGLDTANHGETIGCYSLRSGGTPTSFAEGPYTTFYREPR